MDFLDFFKGNNKGILSEPGDELNAKVTKTGRKVFKLKKREGKYNSTIYERKNGYTKVDMKVTKYDKNGKLEK